MQHRLLRWLPAAIAPVVIAGAVSAPLVAAAAPPNLPSKTPQQVLQLAAKANDLPGFTGTMQQTSNLGLPSIPATGPGSGTSTASALDLLAGTHTARVEVAGPSKERVAVLDSSAERDVIRDGRSVWLWSSKTSSATHVLVSGSQRSAPDTAALPTPAEAAKELLAKVGGSTAVSVTTAQRVAGRAAYTLVLTPRTTATTVGSVRIAVDAATGLPLDVQVIARGTSSPAFETGFTSIDYAVPAASRFVFTPPSDAKVTTRSVTPHRPSGHGPVAPAERPAVSGSGWTTVVTIPKAAVPSSLTADTTVQRLTTPVAGGRVLHTSLVNVLITGDGRVLAGAVPVSRLESAAG